MKKKKHVITLKFGVLLVFSFKVATEAQTKRSK